MNKTFFGDRLISFRPIFEDPVSSDSVFGAQKKLGKILHLVVTKADDSEFPAYVPSLKAFSFEKAALRGSEASKRSFPVFLQIVQLLLPPEPQTVGS